MSQLSHQPTCRLVKNPSRTATLRTRPRSEKPMKSQRISVPHKQGIHSPPAAAEQAALRKSTLPALYPPSSRSRAGAPAIKRPATRCPPATPGGPAGGSLGWRRTLPGDGLVAIAEPDLDVRSTVEDGVLAGQLDGRTRGVYEQHLRPGVSRGRPDRSCPPRSRDRGRTPRRGAPAADCASSSLMPGSTRWAEKTPTARRSCSVSPGGPPRGPSAPPAPVRPIHHASVVRRGRSRRGQPCRPVEAALPPPRPSSSTSSNSSRA